MKQKNIDQENHGMHVRDNEAHDPNHVTDVSVFVKERSNIPGPSTQAIQIENKPKV